MAEPFVFYFTPGHHHRIEVMYILDLDCRCGLCGHTQFQRFYHSTPLHSLTLPTLESLADSASLKAGYECENCGDPVGANEVQHTALTYGFGDDAGLIRIFDDLTGGRRQYELTARRRLDPQAVPRWEADRQAFSQGHCVVDTLDEQGIERFFGRPLNLKIPLRDLIDRALENEAPAICTRLSPGYWVIIADDEERAAALRDDLDTEPDLCPLVLDESGPRGLPTHGDPLQLGGRWSRWVSDPGINAIRDGDLRVELHLSTQAATDMIAHIFELGRLSYDTEQTPHGPVFSAITTPRDHQLRGRLSVIDVLRRAAFTGLTPGEAARLSAEEIVGELLQVW